MIGIIGAMEIEVLPLMEMMENSVEKSISGIKYVSGEISGKRVVCAVCGVGKVFAAVCAQTMILEYSPEVIVNTGVAGTLTDELHIGEIALSDSLVQHDMDISELGYEPGYVCDLGRIYIPADSRAVSVMADCIEREGIRYKRGVIASGDQFIGNGERKNYIKNTFSAVACEMEGAGIAQVCFMGGVPFCVIRAISDEANGAAAADYPAFAKKAAEKSVKITVDFIKEY